MENPQHPVFAQAAAQRCSESELQNKEIARAISIFSGKPENRLLTIANH